MNLSSTHKLYLWLTQCLLLALFGVFIFIEKPITFNANLTSLFSVEHHNQWQAVQKKIDANLNTSLLYLVGHSQQRVAIQAADQLALQLKQIDGIENVSAQLKNIPNQQSLIDSYSGFEQQLLTPAFTEYLVQKNKQIFDLQFQLLNQLGDQIVGQTIAKDPTLALAHYLNRSPFPSNKLTITSDGYLTLNYQNNHYVLVTMKTAEGAFDLKTTKSIVSQLDNISAPELATTLTDTSKVLPQDQAIDYIRTGAIFYSYEASEQAQQEMQWLGGLSILATLLLIYFAYRRFVTLFCTIFLIGISIVYGFLGLNLFFDEVNVLSLVFAVTLIGIAADYSFHSLTELQYVSTAHLSPLKNINVSLILSFLTTALGYLLLVVVPIVIFKQIAVFTIFGLFGALITVLLVFPYLHQRINFASNVSGEQDNNTVFFRVNKQHQAMLKNWRGYSFFILTLSLLSLVILGKTVFSDDAKSFYQVPAQLLETENKVKKMLGQKLDNQYLLLQAETPQALLENEEKALVILNNLQAENVFASYQAVANWLPSIKQQQRNNALLISSKKQGQFDKLSVLLGNNDVIVQPINHYLLPSHWFNSSIGKLFKHLWLQDNNNYYSMIKFAGIRDVNTLSNALSVLENAVFVDKLADTELELGTFRLVLAYIFVAACLAGFVIFYLRYGFKKACLGVVVPACAFAIALAISAVLQGNLTLFNLAAGLVILALGLDYSIFYAEHGFSILITKTTLMSALSSIFVFAILSFSLTPAIASFGQTVFLGIVLTFMLAPIMTKISGKRGHNASK